MTGTPDDNGGSRPGETNGTEPATAAGPAADTDPAAATGPTAAPGPATGAGPTAPSGQASDRWEQWRARARELWAVTWRGAKQLWAAARPILDQLRWVEAEASPVTLVDRRAAPTLLVPAQGQVYHFVVRVTFTWTTNNARPELFGWYVDQFQPQAMQRFRRIAVRCAAEFPPDRPRAFALTLDDAMTGDDALPWGYERGEVTFTCEPDVSVDLDEPVRDLLRPYWDKRIALEWKRDLERRRAEYAEERRRGPAEPDGSGPAEPDGSGTPEPDNGATPPEPDDGATPAGMPESLREEPAPRQREAPSAAEAAPRRPAQQRRGPRPDSPVEQFNLLDPMLQPPGPRSGELPPPDDPTGGDPEKGGTPEA